MGESDRKPTVHLFVAMLPWVGMQFIALALAAMRVQSWARHPAPAEQFALELMSAVQVAGASLLVMSMLRDRVHTIIAIISALPFTMLAATLGFDSPMDGLIRFAFVAAWMLALASWLAWAAKWNAGWLVALLGPLWALGGTMAWYVTIEFGESSGGQWKSGWSPIFGAIDPEVSGFAIVGAVAGVGLMLSLLNYVRTCEKPGSAPA